ncbi:MAG: transposase [Bradyrhizobium sp.]|uniref:transposase n=1 Tax=Bradyrhizobium sp. TaxID=376 RepID=UPI003C6812A5
MAEKPQSYYGTWINRQRSLLPGLDEELDPLTAKLEHLIIILDTLGLEAFVAPPSRGRGRPPDDRPAIARSFVAKAVLTIPTTSALIERLQIDRALRRICGWERRSEVPSEATFSRAFAEFAAQGLPERVHEQLVRRHLHDHIVGHISRDATEIAAREKPRRRSSDDPPPPAPRKRGRPRKHEVLPSKPLTRIELQRTQSLDEMRAGLPTQCDVGVKRNSKGFRETWIGYKLHLDTANGIIPIAAILTAASIHDSQVAIPLARTSEQRVVWLYDLMDSAYDAQPIIDDCLAAGRVPVIDRNTRRDTALKAEIAAERARRRLIKIPDPTDLTYNERTTAERANARIKDEFGGRHLRVRGHLKAFCHLMFGVVALAADSIVRLFSARFYIHPA